MMDKINNLSKNRYVNEKYVISLAESRLISKGFVIDEDKAENQSKIFGNKKKILNSKSNTFFVYVYVNLSELYPIFRKRYTYYLKEFGDNFLSESTIILNHDLWMSKMIQMKIGN